MRIDEWTEENLEHLYQAAAQASQETWEWGHSATETLDDAVAYAEKAIRKGKTGDLYLVFFNKEDESLTVALTGNGPTSEANSYYLHLCEPATIRSLIDELRKTRKENTA